MQAGSYQRTCTAMSRTAIWILVGARLRAMPLMWISFCIQRRSIACKQAPTSDAFDFNLLDWIQRRSIACKQAPTSDTFDFNLLDWIQRRSIARKQAPTTSPARRCPAPRSGFLVGARSRAMPLISISLLDSKKEHRLQAGSYRRCL